MELILPKKTSKEIEEASVLLGLKKQEIVSRAVLLYLDNLHKYLELKKELVIWDSLSDEALLNFEKALK